MDSTREVAMKDLEIRGAGNILGEEQSGHVVAIGFDLYCKLLRKTVEQLKKAKTTRPYDIKPEFKEPQIKLGVEGRIPQAYIPHFQQRLQMYRRLAETQTMESLEELKKECLDRYGAYPQEFQRLCELSVIRIAAAAKNIDLVELKDHRAIVV